jgi:ribosomal protein L31E
MDENGAVVFALERARPPMHALRTFVKKHVSRLQVYGLFEVMNEVNNMIMIRINELTVHTKIRMQA